MKPSRQPWGGDQADFGEFLSVADIARMLGIPAGTVYTWHTVGKLPRPDAPHHRSPLWSRVTIEAWAVRLSEDAESGLHFTSVKRTVQDMKPVYYTRAQLIPMVAKTSGISARAARNRIDSARNESDAVDAAGNPLWSADLVAKIMSERSGIMRDKS